MLIFVNEWYRLIDRNNGLPADQKWWDRQDIFNVNGSLEAAASAPPVTRLADADWAQMQRYICVTSDSARDDSQRQPSLRPSLLSTELRRRTGYCCRTAAAAAAASAPNYMTASVKATRRRLRRSAAAAGGPCGIVSSSVLRRDAKLIFLHLQTHWSS